MVLPMLFVSYEESLVFVCKQMNLRIKYLARHPNNELFRDTVPLKIKLVQIPDIYIRVVLFFLELALPAELFSTSRYKRSH